MNHESAEYLANYDWSRTWSLFLANESRNDLALDFIRNGKACIRMVDHLIGVEPSDRRRNVDVHRGLSLGWDRN